MNKYPWLVRLSTVAEPEKGFCGGTLVASKYVITACHCTYEKDKITKQNKRKYLPADLKVSIGDHKQDTWNESGREKRLIVKSIKRHPKYEKNQIIPGPTLNNGYDIAILELWVDVDLTQYTPACLAKQTDGTRFNGKRAVAYGWGKTANPSVYNPSPTAPNEPYEVELKVGSSSCIKLAEKKNDAMIMMGQEPRIMCAGSDIDGGAGTCGVSIVKLLISAKKCSYILYSVLVNDQLFFINSIFNNILFSKYFFLEICPHFWS